MDSSTVTLLSLVIAALAALGTFTGPLRGRRRKELSFGLTEKRLLAFALSEVASDTQIFYKGQSVERVASASLALMNTGDVPIEAVEFEKRPRIVLQNVLHIFDLKVLKCSPSHLAPSCLIESPNAVSFEPLLLNPGDYMLLQVTFENKGEVSATLDARVRGIPSFFALRRGQHPGYNIGGIIFYFAMFACLVGGVFVAARSSGLAAVVLGLLSLAPLTASVVMFREALQMRRSRWLGRSPRQT